MIGRIFNAKGKFTSLIYLLIGAMVLTVACTAQPTATLPAATQTPAPIANTPSPVHTPTAASPHPADTLTPTEAPMVATTASGDVASEIRNFALETLTVSKGATITWTNRDGASHTSTSGTPQALGGIWDSGVLSREDSYNFTFNEPGEFPYFCAIHNSMRGMVTVTQ
ncbi:MAG: plastocyanin/azurin family copper-binding protein [Chloroflexi bacterium]|nr:plastocyanin/azurin family copper-binding protein [Chloroflexota bacterium]PKB57688.1 MAG: hypothetical protein BZY73_01975 [SAR202 cluster bacterium Casp-Chloro-G3]